MKQANLGLNADQLEARQVWLQGQARTLMTDQSLIEILSNAGTPQVVGSFELDLIVWPDLDIEIITPDPPETAAVLRVVQILIDNANFSRMTISDTRAATKPEVPRGMYVGPDVVHGELTWQLDLWFLSQKQMERRKHLTDTFRALLTPANRRTILELKQYAAASDKYHRGVSSVDLYSAVLEHNVTTLDEFHAWLGHRGKSL
jgi:hypothetical protein